MRISLSFLRIFLPLLASSVLFGAPSNLQVDTKTRALAATDGGTIIDAKAVTLTVGGFTIYDGAGVKTVVTGSTSGAMFGAAGNKIGFLGATPVVRPVGTTDLRQALINLGLYTTGGASPLNLNGGAFTAGAIAGTNETLSGTLGVTGLTTLTNLTGNGVATFRSGTNFSLLDSTDATKRIQFDITNIATGTTRTVNVPNVNSTTAQAKAVVANQFLTSMSAQGAFTSAQPVYDDLSGLPVLPDDTEAAARSFFTGYNAVLGEFEIATPSFTDIDGIAVTGQIPSLDAAKITTGAFDSARIPSLDAAKVTTGAFDVARIPALDFSKIPTGVVPKAQLPVVTAYLDTEQTFLAAQNFYSLASNSVVSTVLATPAAPSVSNVGVPGATTWTYKIVAKLSDGASTAASATGSTATGNATLDASNKNSLTWAAVAGAASYDVYRTVVGLVPNSSGKIASVSTNSYIDTGAAGDGSTAPASNNTGRVSGAIFDKGGQFYNIMAYGGVKGVSDGVANSNAMNAIYNDMAGRGVITIPAGDFYFAEDMLLGANRDLHGFGRYITNLIFLNGKGIVLGTGVSRFQGKIAGITILGSAAYTDFDDIPTGSIGITALHYNDVVIEDCYVAFYDIGIRAGGNASSGLTMSRTHIFEIKSKNIWLFDAIDTKLHDVHCGRLGSAHDPSVGYIVIGGASDTLFVTTFNGIGTFDDNDFAAIMFENLNSPNGIFHFSEMLTERVGTLMRSDAATTSISDVQFIGSRLWTTFELVDLHANTSISSLQFVNNTQIVFYESTTIRNTARSLFIGNIFNRVAGAVTLTLEGGAGLGELMFSNNISETDITLSGAWKILSSIGNQFRFNGVTEVAYTLTATGSVTSIGNIKDVGTQPLNVFASDFFVEGWTSLTPLLLNNWVAYGGQYQAPAYRKDRDGRVWIRGLIKNGTYAANTILFVLPAGYRPTATEEWPTNAPNAGGVTSLFVDASGTVRIGTPPTANTYLNLNSTFSTN